MEDRWYLKIPPYLPLNGFYQVILILLNGLVSDNFSSYLKKVENVSLIWVVIGSICLILLAIPLFMFAAIGADMWNGVLFILPLSCIFSAGIVIYYYFHGGTSASYLWYVLPVFLGLFTAIVFPK